MLAPTRLQGFAPRNSRLIWGLLLAAALLIPLTKLVRAASIVVTTTADNTTDDDLCSLREAIESANNDTNVNGDCGSGGTGADIITFDPGLDGTPITLNGSQLPTITDHLTINGNGEANTIIQASTCNPVTLPGGCTPATWRVFEFSGTTDPDVTLDGLTIRHGNATDPDLGGGIYNESGGNINLTNITISGNKSPHSFTFDLVNWFHSGSGIHNVNSSPTLNVVTFTGNYSAGMTNVSSSPTLSNVTFSDNHIGMYNLNSSSPTVLDSMFVENGTGMFNAFDSNPALTNVAFSRNVSIDVQPAGGGMYNWESSPTLINVSFSDNSAIDVGGDTYYSIGGGMFNGEFSNPDLTDVTFYNNFADFGGGMANQDSSPSLTRVTFSENSASFHGGGMRNYRSSSPTLTDVVFTGNHVSQGGGGMSNQENSNPILTNVVFSGNVAFEINNYNTGGGGLANYTDSSPTLTNVILSGNYSVYGGGVANSNNSNPTLVNVILWDNTALISGSQISNDFSQPSISYSLIEGSGGSANWDTALGTDSGGNIDADPLLVRSPDPGDGDWTTPADNDYGDLRLQGCSPAIDAGDNAAVPAGVTTELDGNPRLDGTVDLGPYERVGGPTCPPTAPSDLSAAVVAGRIDLTWTDNASNEESFTVERSTDGGSDWVAIVKLVQDTTSYSDTAIVCDTTYLYRVKATNSYGDRYSAEFSALSAACPPQSFTAVALTDYAVQLSWVDGSTTNTGFEIEHSADGGNTFTSVGSFSDTTTSTYDLGLTCNTQYLYLLRSTRTDSAHSPYVETLPVVTGPCPATIMSPGIYTYNGMLTAPSINDPRPTYQWTASTPSYEYRVRVRNLTTGVWIWYDDVWYHAGDICVPQEEADPLCSLIHPPGNPLSKEGVYRWFVDSRNEDGVISTSRYADFIYDDEGTDPITELAPLPADLLSPETGSSSSAGNDIIFQWYPVTQQIVGDDTHSAATSYHLNINDANSGSTVYNRRFQAEAICDEEVCTVTLPAGTLAIGEYEWAVRANSKSGHTWTPAEKRLWFTVE